MIRLIGVYGGRWGRAESNRRRQPFQSIGKGKQPWLDYQAFLKALLPVGRDVLPAVHMVKVLLDARVVTRRRPPSEETPS
jgi:hypothetical protein